MIRLGFVVFFNNNWMGGLNYLKNLLFAITRLPDKRIQPVVFLGKSVTREAIAFFEPYAEVVTTPLLERSSPLYWLWSFSNKVMNSDFFLEFALRKHRIDVFSHSMLCGLLNTSAVSWIPDFQHIHLPGMFSGKEIAARNRLFLNLAKKSDLIILSSQAACKDFKQHWPDYADKARVMHFVAQPSRRLLIDDPLAEGEVLKKYAIEEKFFFIPNQFWKHKNHRVVISALKELKNGGIDILVVCSGAMQEYRNNEHVVELKEIIEENHLKVRLLGLIDYDDVIVLMKKSIAVINPSLFEGWSSTVEECKSIGKNMILSDIPVHREQCHPDCVYFSPDDSLELAGIMKKLNAEYDPKKQKPICQKSISTLLEQKTTDFALKYQSLVLEAMLLKQKK